MVEEKEMRWQPIMLLAPDRIECKCGALAIFVALELEEAPDHFIFQPYCQPCFKAAQEVDEE